MGCDKKCEQALCPWPDELGHRRAEDGVTVEDKTPRCGVVGERLAELLHHPGRRRVERGIEVNDVSPAVLYHEEANRNWSEAVGTVNRSIAAMSCL